MKKLVLASSSKSRYALLQRLAITFETCNPDIDETPLDGETAPALVKRLSIAKAQAGAAKISAAWVIGSDQIAVVDGRLLGKPGNPETARSQLSFCSAKTVKFHTGTCLLSTKTGQYTYIETPTIVQVRRLTSQEISRYVEFEKPFDCAGSFHAESLGISLFEQVKSDDPSAVLGLPLIKLCELLRNAGFLLP